MDSWSLPVEILISDKLSLNENLKSIPKHKDILPGDGLNAKWGRGKQEESRINCKMCLSIFSNQLGNNNVSRNPSLEGLYTNFRITSWGTIYPFNTWEDKIYRDVARGMVIEQLKYHSANRPIIIVGTWKLCKSATVTVFFLMPAIATSSWSIPSITDDIIEHVRSYLNVESPSSNMKDNICITKSYGPTKIAGRLACSAATILESNPIFHTYATELHTPVSIHLGCSKLMYFIHHNSNTYTCTTSLATLEKLNLYGGQTINMLFDEYMSLSIYSNSARHNIINNIRSIPSKSSNSCIRLIVDGGLRFLGKPHAIAQSFRDLHNLIYISMSNNERASSIIASLRVLSST
ncbi:hypothetical protein HDU92_004520 [Lobulomyces angularis]|nr:hypothetical protein HDU92_004520 [Lobulomyces angularis]